MIINLVIVDLCWPTLIIVSRSFITCLHISVAHHFLGNPCSIFFRGGIFLFPRLLCFDFSYDLDLWAEGHALRSFFIGTSFAIILSSVWWGVWSNMSKRKSFTDRCIDRWPYCCPLVDLLLHMLCRARISDLVTKITCAKKRSLIWLYFPETFQ